MMANSTSPSQVLEEENSAEFSTADSTVESSVDEGREHQLIKSPYSMMMLVAYGREGCFALAIIFTVYAALQSCPLKMGFVGYPEPFFPHHSPVMDYYWGNVHHAFDRMQGSDVSFTLYYAPWDAASMDARWEFEKAARYYRDQVLFVAINCWWPDGECRRRFPKIHSFPVMIAYRNSGKGIQFHGPPRTPHLVAFLHNVINPLNVVRTRLDILRLQSKHSAVVVGFFNFKETPQPLGFTSYYVAALKALEKDPARDVAFAVISNDNDALKFGMNTTGNIHLHLWNSTQSYPAVTLSSVKLLQWIFERNHMVVQRLSPPGVKSQMLADVLEKSATIIMMTPRFVTASFLESPFHYLFKEVALDYYNCNASAQVDMIVQVARMQMRQLKLERHSLGNRSSSDNCNQSDMTVLDNLRMPLAWSGCCQTLKKSLATGSDGLITVCEVCSGDCPINIANGPGSRHFRLFPGCFSLLRDYDSRRRHFLCCLETSIDMPSTTSRSTSESLAEERRCSLYSHPQVSNRLLFPRERSGRRRSDNFTGLGCATNRTLTFAVMDSLTHGIFFDRLGVDLSRIPSRTAVAILDNDQESHYMLEDSVTLTSLREFITNFTSGSLTRYLRSSSPTSATSTRDIPATRDISYEDIEVVEVNSNNFNVVMNDTKDVMLLVYTPSCAFCRGVAHIYLTAARYFQAAKDIVFARINGDVNDLPWEFTVDKYPTILFFPANQELESFDYPDDLPITVANLIHFVLLNAKLELRVRMALSLCTAGCIDHNRRLALNKIHALLRLYRVLDGRFRNTLQQLIDGRNVGLTQFRYAKGVVRNMCSVKVQLCHARTLHLVLSTSVGDRLTPGQLDELTRSHGDFREELRARRVECKSLSAKLRNAFDYNGRQRGRSRPVR